MFYNQKEAELREELTTLMQKNDAQAETNDTNYVFLSFVTSVFPKGLVGLLIAVVFLASMGATASAINSLASTTTVDVYKRFVNKGGSEKQYLNASRLFTLIWGVFTVLIALYAGRLGNLLEAVNILGSLFYGTILGVFLVAFYVKKIGGRSVFYAAILTEIFVILIWRADVVAFLWLNLIGCIGVLFFSFVFRSLGVDRKTSSQ